MSSPATWGTSSPASVAPAASKSKSLLSKLFRSRSSSSPVDDISPSDSISISNQPLVSKPSPIKIAAAAEHETFGNLMDKAKRMSPDEFRKYLKQHREMEEAKYRKMGGGIAGGGDWVWRGEKDVRGEYIV